MALNNIRIIIRRFSRHKLTTFLHISGLVLGITVCLLIGLFIKHEVSFDRYQSKSDRTYRLNTVWVDFGKKRFHFSTPFPLADQLRKDVPGLENVTKVHHPFQSIVTINGGKRFRQENVMMTDPEFLDVFDVHETDGNAHEALRQPYRAVLTNSTAKKFFGNENAIGKTFAFNDSFLITVGAVIPDFPANTHLPASMLLSFSDNENYVMTSTTHYGSVSGGSTFIVLPKGTKPGVGLKAAIKSIYDRFVNSQPWMGKDSHVETELQPLHNIHFNSKYAGGGQLVQAINITWLLFFGIVGIAVLILACINFINLSTAQALNRAKEVGVRKAIGGRRGQLILQFLGEALLLVVVAAILALAIAKISLPYINDLTGEQMSLDLSDSYGIMGWLAVGVLITALLAGSYPAWIITRFRPSATLKAGTLKGDPQSAFLRKGLVVVQFSISIVLLIGLLLIGKQMDYMHHKDLGFNKDNVIVLPLPNRIDDHQKTLFGQQLNSIPGLAGYSFSTSPPSGDVNTHWGTIMSKTGRDDPDQKQVTTIMTDDKFCQVYDLKLVAGRYFTAADTAAISESLPEGQRFPLCVVNEKLVREMGFGSPQQALGKRFWIGINGWHAEVVGVVKDFNITSLHEVITPTLITQFMPFCDRANIRIQAGADIPATIARLNSTYKTLFPQGLFEFNFLDQQLGALYRTEARLYGLFKIFSILAMLISCMGLWGLITFAAQQKVKEIGIRKVLGASAGRIASLLTREFLWLVAIAFIIAAPLAYWGISRWLENFAFRINIGWTVFAVAGIIAATLALVTVSYQAVKAAISNPVKSLRSE